MTVQGPVFIDFEASSLDNDSWPIEVGLAWIEGNTLSSVGRLIRPEPDWPDQAWSPASAGIHGIPRSKLDCAEPARVVAALVMNVLGHRVLVSDAPEFDQRWLDRLLDSAPGLARPLIRDFDATIARHFKPSAIERVYSHLDHGPTVHRAEADARKLGAAWLAGRTNGETG